MVNYFKYLPVSQEEKNWGLFVLSAGCTRIMPDQTYPYKSHPSHHNFTWENGRILNEFQLIYITKGKGIFESESAGVREISEGSAVLLFPGELHKYKPNPDTGWDEYWIGFKGEIITNLIKNNFFKKEFPITDLGFNEGILNTILEIIEKTKDEKPGFQSVISGAVLYLLGNLHTITKQGDFNGKDELIKIINKARIIFRANAEQNISPEEVAAELKLSYSYFRSMFKTYVGISPGQYLIQLKIQKAKELLLDPERSIKQIAYDLKFGSNFYFSKIFKDKTGFTPNKYRSMINTKSKVNSALRS